MCYCYLLQQLHATDLCSGKFVKMLKKYIYVYCIILLTKLNTSIKWTIKLLFIDESMNNKNLDQPKPTKHALFVQIQYNKYYFIILHIILHIKLSTYNYLLSQPINIVVCIVM
jgi:hypothetical protein